MILLNQITSAVLQLLIFSGVPFVWYILTQKRVKGFFKWLGISTAPAPPLNAMFCILAGFLAALFLPYMFYSGCVSADRLEYRNICSYTDMGDRADFAVGGNPVPGVSL